MAFRRVLWHSVMSFCRVPCHTAQDSMDFCRILQGSVAFVGRTQGQVWSTGPRIHPAKIYHMRASIDYNWDQRSTFRNDSSLFEHVTHGLYYTDPSLGLGIETFAPAPRCESGTQRPMQSEAISLLDFTQKGLFRQDQVHKKGHFVKIWFSSD